MMINQQQQQEVLSFLIQDSKSLFTLLYDRHHLFNKLQHPLSPEQLSQIILQHQKLNLEQQILIQKYKNKTIKSNPRLKSFLIRFNCRIDQILSKIDADQDIIKYSARDIFELLKKEQNTGDGLVRSLLLHPKVEIQRLISRSMRNRSLNDIKKPKLQLKKTIDANYYSEVRDKRELSEYWSKSSQKLYDTMDLEIKDLRYCLLKKVTNKSMLLEDIIERNKSIQSCIKLYKKDFNIHSKILKMKKGIKSRTILRSKIEGKIKEKQERKEQRTIDKIQIEIQKNRKSNIFSRKISRPLQVLNKANNLI